MIYVAGRHRCARATGVWLREMSAGAKTDPTVDIGSVAKCVVPDFPHYIIV